MLRRRRLLVLHRISHGLLSTVLKIIILFWLWHILIWLLLLILALLTPLFSLLLILILIVLLKLFKLFVEGLFHVLISITLEILMLLLLLLRMIIAALIISIVMFILISHWFILSLSFSLPLIRTLRIILTHGLLIRKSIYSNLNINLKEKVIN